MAEEEKRRWQVRAPFRQFGLLWRILPGRKPCPACAVLGKPCPHDRVLQWLTDEQRWVSIQMGAGALLADFFYENEEVLYPSRLGKMGGKKYLQFLMHAVEHGYEAAYEVLELEKRTKRLREVGHVEA